MSRKGFTLAEILITLTVIGVVAALTIPTLLQKTNDAELKTALKRQYANWQQAFYELSADNAGIEEVFSGDGSPSADANSMNAFLAKLSYIKNCGTGKGCWYDTEQKYLGGSFVRYFDTAYNGNFGKAILTDGSMIAINELPGVCNSGVGLGDEVLNGQGCAVLYIDVNGAKPPNTEGKDFFLFWITKSGIYPSGSHGDGITCEPDSNTWQTDQGCAAKYLSE